MDEQIKSLKQQMDERFAEQDKKLDKALETISIKLDRLLMRFESMPLQSTPQSSTTTDRSELGNNSCTKTLSFNQATPEETNTDNFMFHKFYGTNTRLWIKDCERFFDLFKVPDYERVDVASLHMSGKAEEWMCHYISVDRVISWPEFVNDLTGRFRDNSRNEVDVEVGGGPNEYVVNCECVAKTVVGVTEESQKQIQQQTAPRANPAEFERRLTAETGNNNFSRNLKCDFKLEFPKSEVSSTIAPKMFDESPKKGKLEFVIESELKDKIGEKHDKSEYEVVGEAYEVHSTVKTEVFVGCKIEAELEDRKLRVEVKSGKMHHESLLEALHGDNIGFLIFDPGGSTFDASLLKNRYCLFHGSNNKYWKINSLSAMKSVVNRKRPRTVTTSVWRPISTEAKWSIECMVNDQISAHDEAGEVNELCSSESSSTVSKKYDEGNSLGRNMMTELKWMENLGYEAHRHNTMVDRLCAGKCPVRVSIVQTLAKACGGVLLIHDDFGKAFGVNLQRAFKRAACFHGLLGVRCSNNISVTQVTSPGEEGNNSSLYIQMLIVEEMQCFALALEIRSDIKSEYVYFQLAVQHSNIYHVDVSRVITVRLPTVTSWVLTVLGYLAKLVLGILGLVVSNAWIAHIVIYLLIHPPLSAFLNKVFIKLDDIWGLRGTAAFAFFCMYRLFAVIAWTTMLLCNTTPWTSGSSLDDPNVFAAKSPSESGSNMAKAVIASMALVIDDCKNLWVVLVGGFTRNILVFDPGGADLNYVLTSSFN